MSPDELLSEILQLNGVTGAAILAPSGELLACLPEAGGPGSLADARELLSSSLASSRTLAGLLGAEAATQTMTEFDGGTLLLTLSTGGPGAPLGVVALSSAQDVGRVRFGLRRLLPQLTVS